MYFFPGQFFRVLPQFFHFALAQEVVDVNVGFCNQLVKISQLVEIRMVPSGKILFSDEINERCSLFRAHIKGPGNRAGNFTLKSSGMDVGYRYLGGEGGSCSARLGGGILQRSPAEGQRGEVGG